METDRKHDYHGETENTTTTGRRMVQQQADIGTAAVGSEDLPVQGPRARASPGGLYAKRRRYGLRPSHV